MYSSHEVLLLVPYPPSSKPSSVIFQVAHRVRSGGPSIVFSCTSLALCLRSSLQRMLSKWHISISSCCLRSWNILDRLEGIHMRSFSGVASDDQNTTLGDSGLGAAEESGNSRVEVEASMASITRQVHIFLPLPIPRFAR